MTRRKLSPLTFGLTLIMLLLNGCSGAPAEPIATTVLSTATLAPPTLTPTLPFTTTLGPPSQTPTLVPDMNLWTKKASMQTARYGLSTSVVNGKIYAIGGFGGLTIVEEYDPSINAWTRKTDMPTGRGFLSTSVVNGKIYAIGGNSGPNVWGTTLATVEEYNPETDTWTKKSDMTNPRDGFSTNVVNGKIYAIGGSVVKSFENGNTLISVEEYDPVTNTWTMKADMHRGRDMFTTVVVDEKIYTIGGFSPYEEMYDPVTDTWVKKAPMPKLRIGASASAVNSKIYVFGGDESGGGPPTSIVFEYDPESDIWAILDGMPFEGLAMSAIVLDGNIFIIGGSDKAYPHHPPHLSAVWEYTPAP